MKVLLINPPFFETVELIMRRYVFNHWIATGNMYIHPFEPPLNLACVASFLKTHGVETHLIDAQGELLSEDDIISRVNTFSPHFVGITTMTPTFPFALRIARLIKRDFPEMKIVMGGVHPTVIKEDVLKHHEIDFVIEGEGEFSFLELLIGNTEYPGIYRLENNKIKGKKAIIIEEIDSLPLPDYTSFPAKNYIEYTEKLRGIKGISYFATRGCPFPCSFCAVKCTMGRRWRTKRPETVITELKILKEQLKVEGIWFKDSILNLKKEWISQLAHLMLKEKLNLKWQMNTRVDLVREDEISLLSEAGLTQVDLGIESGSERSLKTLKKFYTVNKIKNAVRILKKYVKVAGFFMIGIPGETEEDIQKTINLIEELNLDACSISLFQPLPGSDLYNIIKPDVDYSSLHFTFTNHSWCEIPHEKLIEIYFEMNENFVLKKEKSQVCQASGGPSREDSRVL